MEQKIGNSLSLCIRQLNNQSTSYTAFTMWFIVGFNIYNIQIHLLWKQSCDVQLTSAHTHIVYICIHTSVGVQENWESLHRPTCVRVCVYSEWVYESFDLCVCVCVFASPPFRHGCVSIYIPGIIKNVWERFQRCFVPSDLTLINLNAHLLHSSYRHSVPSTGAAG